MNTNGRSKKNGLNGLWDYVKNTAWHRSKFAIFYLLVIMLFWLLAKGFIDRRLEKESKLTLEHSRAEKRFHSVSKQADDLKNRNAYLREDARRFSEKIAADKIKRDQLEQSLRERNHKIYLAEQEKARLEAEQKKRAEELDRAKQRLALAKAKFEEMKNSPKGIYALQQKIQNYAQQNQLLKIKLSDYQEQFVKQQNGLRQINQRLQQTNVELRDAEQYKQQYAAKIDELHRKQEHLNREIKQKEKEIADAQNDIIGLSQQAYRYQLERRQKEEKEAQLVKLQQELADSKQKNQKLAADLRSHEQKFLHETEINEKRHRDEIFALQQQQQTLSRKIEQKEKAIAAAKNDIACLSQQAYGYQLERREKEKKEAQLAQLQQELAASQQENQRLAADLSDREQKFLQETEINKKQYLDEISTLRRQQQQLKQEMASKEQEIADARGNITVLDKHNQEKHAQLARLQQELAEREQAQQKLVVDLNVYKQKLQRKDDDVLHLSTEQDNLKQQLYKLQESEAELKEAIRSSKEELESINQQNIIYNNRLKDKENEITAVKEELQRQTDKMEEAENQYSSTIGKLQTQNQDLEKQLELKNEELEKRNKELEHEIQEKEDFIANFDADESEWKIKYDSEKEKVKSLTEENSKLQEQNQQLQQQQSASGSNQPFKRDNVLDDFKSHGSWFISKPAPSDIKIHSGRHHSQNFVQEVGMDMGEIARQYAFIESVTSCEYGAAQTGKMYLSAKQNGQFAYTEEKYALRIYDKDQGYGAEVLLAATTPCEAVVQAKMIQYLKPKYQSYHLSIKI